MKIVEGGVYKSNNYGHFRVLSYHGCNSIDVEFLKTGYITRTKSQQIREGMVKDYLLPSVYGVGYIGVGSYGWRDRSYKFWAGMLQRCYSPLYRKKWPTYTGCAVHEDWHDLQNFSEWFNENYRDGYQLDKDLLFSGNKVYSKDTCVFVPSNFNNFIISSNSSRGMYPVGVCYNKLSRKFSSGCNNGSSKIHLGFFSNPNDAHKAWMDFKLRKAMDMKLEMDEIDERIYPNVVNLISNIK